MAKRISVWLLGVLVFCSCSQDRSRFRAVLPSPEFKTHLYFELYHEKPFFLVYFENEKLIDWSQMGFELSSGQQLNNSLLFSDSFENREIAGPHDKSLNEIFDSGSFNSLQVELQSKTNVDLKYLIHFRVYDDGIAFNYQFIDPKGYTGQENFTELSEFDLDTGENRWVSDSTAGIAGAQSYRLPFRIVSEKGISVHIDQVAFGDYPEMRLKERGEVKYEYIGVYQDKIAIRDLFSRGSTSWKTIRFDKTF